MAGGDWYPMYPAASTAYKSPVGGAYVEVEDAEAPYKKRSFRQKYLGGLKRTLRAFVAVACIVLITNVSWLGYARAKYGIKDGYGIIKQGECDSVKETNTWLHLAINILSTLLLTGSNAFMAAFSCPSRQEVDRAHQRGRFLHVGSLSLGNLRAIAKRKGFVVLILALSSVPFHLLYNSLVFTSLSTNEYYWTVTTDDFLTGAAYNLTGPWTPTYPADASQGLQPYFSASPPNGTSYGDTFFLDPDEAMGLSNVMYDYYDTIQSLAPTWERLENKDCIVAYENVFLSSRRNVVLVTSVKNDTNSVLTYGSSDMSTAFDTNWWICSMAGQDGGYLSCNPRNYLSNASSWEVWGYPIDYCLSQPTKDICTIEFSQTIMYIVIAFNALKVVAMTWILFRFDAEQILTSVGDAASSFLKVQDQTTAMMCLANKREMRKFWQSRGFAVPLSSRRHFWGSAVSKKRWALFFFSMIFAFASVLFFGVWGFAHVKDRGIGLDPSSLWSLGFGAINQNTIVLADQTGTPVTMSLLANIPQVILALIYLLYMGIMTSMFLAADWASFAFKAQTLMVSSPAGKQRGTWLLGAPLGWGIALLALQTLLHWFVSQSIFVVQMSVFNKDGSPVQSDPDEPWNGFSKLTNCGYSPIAIIFAVVAAGVLLSSAIVFLWRRFPAGSPPVVSTCSAAISAACHVADHRVEEMVYGELRWGVYGSAVNGVGHCSLVSARAWEMGYAGPPGGGFVYA